MGSNPLRICNINLAPPAETEIQLTGLRRKDAAYQEAMYLKERDKGDIVQKRRGYGKELSCDQLAQLRQDLKLAPPRPAHMDD